MELMREYSQFDFIVMKSESTYFTSHPVRPYQYKNKLFQDLSKWVVLSQGHQTIL